MMLFKVEDRITQLCFQEKTENQKETIKQLEQTFGENWGKLTSESQNYLVSVEAIFKALWAQDKCKP